MKQRLPFIFLFFLALNLNSQNLYDIDHISNLEITFEISNWDNVLDQYYANDDGERLLATVTIDGVTFDSVGVRYKGNATYSSGNDKNPFNIKLDHIKDQDYQGFETLKLSNGSHDPSFVREVLSYEIARKYMTAPLSNYCKVYVNGSYHGLYSSSESINGDFGERYLFADGDNPRFKCNTDENGFGSNSSLEYEGSDSTNYYGDYILKSDYGWADLAELIDVLTNAPEDIESLLDMDKAIWMLAFNNVLVNMDSYSGRKANYYLHKDDNGIFNTIPWDMNESLGGFEQIGSGPGGSSLSSLINLSPEFHAGDLEYPLIKLVLEDATYKRMYIAHCKTILEENFANGWYELRGFELQELISDAIQSDPNALYTYNQFVSNMTSNVSGTPGPGGVQGAYGITTLFDSRVSYLQNLSTYQAEAPEISNINTTPAEIQEYSDFWFNTTISNATSAWMFFRHSTSEEFEKTQLFDDGSHNDGSANDGVFGVQITTFNTDIEYYIYAENNNAGIFAPERAAHEFYNLNVINTAGDIVINEFMADNENTIADQDGEFDDWIELYNNTSTAINLAGYYLSDDADEPLKWAFPDVTIAANGYLIIWADDDEDQEGLHSNFKLSANGETILLSNPDGQLVDQVTYGGQTEDISTGRSPNGIGDFTSMNPTFDGENELVNSISEPEPNTIDIQLYPNPVSDWLTIKIESSVLDASRQLTLFNISGKKIFQKQFTSALTEIDVSYYSPGIYIVQIVEDGQLLANERVVVE